MVRVNNGRRVPASFGTVSAIAGVVDREDGAMEVAFVARLAAVQSLTMGTVDGDAVTIRSVRRSEFVPSMVVLIVEPA